MYRVRANQVCTKRTGSLFGEMTGREMTGKEKKSCYFFLLFLFSSEQIRVGGILA